MLFFRSVPAIVLGIALLASCTRHVEQPVVDYTEARTMKLPGWDCHQVHSVRFDSLRNETFLDVEAFPGKLYPGFVLFWLQGDWSKYAELQIKTRICNRDSMQFYVTVWDGKGDYNFENRFQGKYSVKKDWTLCKLNFKDGIFTGKGKRVDLKHVKTVVFFTNNTNDTIRFHMKSVSLQ
jgi:hypothetical protein